MSRILELLKTYLKVEMSQETLNEIASFSELKTFSADEIIYREHKDSRVLCLVISGQVDVQYLLKSGRRKTLDSCNVGDILLWSAVVEPHETNSIGICRTKTELLEIDGKKLLAICEKDTRFGYHMMSLIAAVLRRRNQATRMQLSFYDR